MGYIFKENYVAGDLIMSLPEEEYQHVKQSFDILGIDRLTLEAVKNIIPNDDKRTKDSSCETGFVEALLASKNGEKKGYQKKDKKNTAKDCTCFICGKKDTKRKTVNPKKMEKNIIKQQKIKEKGYLAESTGKETSRMSETASFVGFDDIFGRVVTGGIDPMTDDVFNTNSSLRENENPDDVPSSIFCDVALFRRYASDNDSTDWIIDSCATNMQKTLWGIGLKEINQRLWDLVLIIWLKWEVQKWCSY